jgi:2-(1,2-epoxy-1,2-dihydrophenyl)acetyl-CoA isomerase
MPHPNIDYRLENGVAVIRLNAPDKLNAVSTGMADAIREALEQCRGEAGAVVLGGVGRAFCSGADLSGGVMNQAGPDSDLGSTLESSFNPLVQALRDFPAPVVTAVRGAAAGVGCALALMGDIIVAGESAYFLQAFRNIGLVPDGGSSYLLSRAVGRVRAMQMMLLGQRLPAAKALDWGLITQIAPDDEVDDVALAVARELADGPRALGMIKALAWAALDAPMDEQLMRERTLQRDAGRTEDFGEGVAAFLEKRPAKFRQR